MESLETASNSSADGLMSAAFVSFGLGLQTGREGTFACQNGLTGQFQTRFFRQSSFLVRK